MTIIEAPTEDKQCMFEAAEVMNALLNAVEAGKKNLRIDYTPYRVLDGPKHWKKQAQETIKEVDSRDPDELEEERERKREQVANFMERYEENLDDRLGKRDDLEMEYEEEEKKKQKRKQALLRQGTVALNEQREQLKVKKAKDAKKK